MSVLIVYSRQGCHLCEVLLEELLPMVQGRLAVEIRDIDTHDEWREHYDVRIPVLTYDDEELCQYTLDRAAVNALLERLDSDA